MVSLKSFLHYFSPARPAQPLSEAEKQQIEALIHAFGAKRILRKWTPVLPVCGLAFAILRPWTPKHYSSRARWGLLFLVSRCMLFSVNSPMRCVSFWMNILPPGNK
ncbi:PTS system glucose-specific transporter subunit IIBC [Klebsiella pneumoniae]|uniref:PTS system glucose-specific transporter subunit IIBC n=1 Tax=Klebsiella pneumoniae TaxID=573 RepID=A0A2X3C1C8_KLEPN|nr:PTS system glucose-specific transporter subunit IIBC [Klebsiella pneumoniae]